MRAPQRAYNYLAAANARLAAQFASLRLNGIFHAGLYREASPDLVMFQTEFSIKK
jgi:hypothetical protein